MQTFVGLLVLSLALAANGASLNSRIVGGSDAPEGKYPYQVSLWIHDRFQCGGSIINERYILTAAHCIAGLKSYQITVKVGSHMLYGEGARYESMKLITHEKYSFENTINDIGLIRLANKIVFSDKVQPIALPTEDLIKEGSSVVLTGWGRLWAGGETPKVLQEIDLKVISKRECNKKYSKVEAKQICTLTKWGEGACNGDSGGPLVVDGVEVGIVSYGNPCAVGWPDVFTRVHSYLDWIAANVHLD